jgi:ABC-type sugar transport system permease subunit
MLEAFTPEAVTPDWAVSVIPHVAAAEFAVSTWFAVGAVMLIVGATLSTIAGTLTEKARVVGVALPELPWASVAKMLTV